MSQVLRKLEHQILAFVCVELRVITVLTPSGCPQKYNNEFYESTIAAQDNLSSSRKKFASNANFLTQGQLQLKNIVDEVFNPNFY